MRVFVLFVELGGELLQLAPRPSLSSDELPSNSRRRRLPAARGAPGPGRSPLRSGCGERRRCGDGAGPRAALPPVPAHARPGRAAAGEAGGGSGTATGAPRAPAGWRGGPGGRRHLNLRGGAGGGLAALACGLGAAGAVWHSRHRGAWRRRLGQHRRRRRGFRLRRPRRALGALAARRRARPGGLISPSGSAGPAWLAGAAPGWRCGASVGAAPAAAPGSPPGGRGGDGRCRRIDRCRRAAWAAAQQMLRSRARWLRRRPHAPHHWRIRRAASYPLSLGIPMSRQNHVGRNASAASTAAWPSWPCGPRAP